MFAPKILLFAAAAWLLVVFFRKRRGGLTALTTLGVAAIIGGLVVFGMRSSRHDFVHVAMPLQVHDTAFENGDFVKIESRHPEVRFQPSFPFDSDVEFDGPPKWMIISMGTLLVIAGSLLAGRERTRPIAMKAFTVLGVGAIVYSVVTFFGEPPRIAPAKSRIAHVSRSTRGKSPEPTIEHKAKRPSRAKRPASRPQRPDPDSEQASIETLPPRAGEIPVSVELATSETKVEAKTETKVEPAPAPVAEPTPPAPAATAPSVPAAVDVPAPSVETPPATAATTTSPAASTPPAAPTPPVAPTSPAAQPPTPTATVHALPVAVASKPAESKPGDSIDRPTPRPSAGRPQWVDSPAKLSNSVYTISISSGLFVSVPECQREINAQMKLALDHYIDEYRGDQASKLVSLPLAYLNERVKKAEYSELVNSDSVGPMHQIHALLEIDDRTRADIDRLWHNAVVTDRLWYTGAGAALVLALLGTFYGYLRLDLRTGGAQKGRLQLAATLVALIVAAGALLARWAVPF
jgi:hypothetical protein